MKVRLISAVAVVILLSWTRNIVVLHGQEEGWASVGPEGGTTYALAIDPHDHSVVYAGTNGGVFKSIDRGAHWSPVNAGLPLPGSAEQNGGPYIRSLAIDPQNTATVYAGVSFFGDTLFAEPRGSGVYKSDDGGNSWHAANMGIADRIIYALAIDPVNPTTLYAIGQPGPNGFFDLFKSTDGGTTWSNVLGPFAFAAAVVIDPQTPATVYAGVSGALFKTTDGGTTWARMDTGLAGQDVTALAINPANTSIVYAATGAGGVFKSVNAGNTWTPVNTGLTALSVTALGIDVSSPRTLYAGLVNGAIFKTKDKGATWVPVNTGLEGSRINNLAIDPETPRIVYAATDWKGVYKTGNGGDRWRQTSLSTIRVFSIAADSTAAKTLVGADRGHIYLRSHEGEWTSPLSPETGRYSPGNPVGALAIDPLVPTTAYAAAGGVVKTTDGGATWSSVLGGRVFTVALDPIVPSTLYAGGNGAHKSVDGGATWTDIPGLPAGPVQLLVVDPQTPNTLYAGFGGFQVGSGPGSLHKSVNGGSDWTLVEGLPSVGVLAIDPQVTSTLYAGDRGSRGVFKSINGGDSWSLSSTGLSTFTVVALAVHPNAPSIVFAGTYGGGIFRSTNGGASWAPMDDQPSNLLIRALAIDAGSSTLYAGTDGGGVFTIAAPADSAHGDDDRPRDRHDCPEPVSDRCNRQTDGNAAVGDRR